MRRFDRLEDGNRTSGRAPLQTLIYLPLTSFMSSRSSCSLLPIQAMRIAPAEGTVNPGSSER